MKAFLLAALACFAVPAQAQDAGRGRLLYETHCVACHYERIHKRDPARSLVRDRAMLEAEVARRAALVPAQRFAQADLRDIAEFLDRTHYRFAR